MERIVNIVAELKCPKCNSNRFLAGPRGGAVQNVKCAECGYWMNVTPIQSVISTTDAMVAGGFWITDEQEA